MSRHINDWDGPDTAFVVTRAVAFVDTLTLFCWGAPPAHVLRRLRLRVGRRLLLDNFEVQKLRRKGCLVTIHQPDRWTLEFLDTIRRGKFVVHAVHIAVDFLCANRRHAELATAFLTRGAVQKWRRRAHQSHIKVHSRYWNVNSRAKRNIALYGDRKSKTGLGPCAHFELRFTGAEACNRAGVGDLNSIMRGVDAMTLLQRQVWIAFIDRKRLNRAIEKMARKTVLKRQRRRGWPSVTVNDVRTKLQQMLPRCIADEGDPLDWASITNARSQSLWDHQRNFRSCLTDRIEWAQFTPKPTWHWW